MLITRRGNSKFVFVTNLIFVFVLVFLHPTKANILQFHACFRGPYIFGSDPELKCRKVVLEAGEGLMIPGGVPHCVRTQSSSIARGFNFLWEKQMG